MNKTTRRRFLGAIAAGATMAGAAPFSLKTCAQVPVRDGQRRILKTLKWGMIREPDLSLRQTLQMLKEIGFDGVEIDTPGEMDFAEVRSAAREIGFCIDGSVNSRHWEVRLTDPDPGVREQAFGNLMTSIRDTSVAGGHSVLLVPGLGSDGTKPETWSRAQEQIRRTLPEAARLGIYILIENVWNQMFYEHEGSNTQTADELANFVDEIDSPWVGVQFDVGNHQKYGDPSAWIRRLGRRIVKLDIKDWGKTAGFCKLGDGDVRWGEVRKALSDVGYCGWAAAEVEGGNRQQLRDVVRRMDEVLGLS